MTNPETPETKTIHLSFQVPADLDTPSEVLADMKTLVMYGVGEMYESCTWANPCLSYEQRALCEALLTESS